MPVAGIFLAVLLGSRRPTMSPRAAQPIIDTVGDRKEPPGNGRPVDDRNAMPCGSAGGWARHRRLGIDRHHRDGAGGEHEG